MKTQLRSLVIVVLALVLVSCASVPQKPAAPKLSVLGVTPLKMGFDKQTFRFNLNAFNPNGFKLPIKKIDFIARFAGIDVGEGLTTEAVTLSPNSDTAFSMDVNTDLSKLVSNIGDLVKLKGMNFDYQIEGKMRFVESGLFEGVGVPFNLKGNLMDKFTKAVGQ